MQRDLDTLLSDYIRFFVLSTLSPGGDSAVIPHQDTASIHSSTSRLPSFIAADRRGNLKSQGEKNMVNARTEGLVGFRR
ncbi:hypothetical protein KC358_g13 [Hortaea werneckii]|nr:hypothetical protein KC358_g13 [Hortaea werneckii]